MSYQSVNEPCSILEQDGKCGETESLAIIKEFKRQYESKMSKIDNEAGGDNLPGLQAKVLLQREWIRDLTAQNELLIRAMEELEKEATERVIMLESRLKHQAEKTNEVMQKYISINLDEIFQNLVYLQSDVRNLLKFIKRIREEDSWNIDGLKFHNITCQDLFGTDCDCSSVCLHEMSSKEKGCSGGPCLDYNKINAELEKNLKEKEKQLVDISAKYNQKCEEAITAKRSLMDVRNALTVEVAEKHDVILNLRRDVQQLEENIRQSNKQILFKDDIIKELRKEIKSFKDENSLDTQETYEVLKNKIQVLQTEIENLRKTLEQEQEHLNEAEKRIHSLMTERDALKIKNDELLNQFKIEKNNYIKEIDELKRKNKLSENAYVELEKANATHTLELESSKRTSRVLNMDLEKLASEINEKDSIITSLEKDLRELQKQNKKALDQIVTLTVENQAKVEKIEENQAILKHLEDRKEIITGVKNFECTDAEVSFNSSNHKNIADKGSSRSVKFNDAAVASSSSGNWVTSDSASTDDEEIERQTVRVVKTLEQTVSTDSSDQRRINELEKALERALTERENERSKHNQEIFNLRKAIEELEKSGQNEICKGHNLQNAVDLYRNSIILLEANEERARSEINLQRQTIQNLQESLVITKRQLEQYQQKSSRDVSGWFGGWFGSNSSNVLKPSISENEFLHEI